MEKMHCDIIKDLIPSYVDGVCSQTTKQCVEEHITDCEDCRRTVDFYRTNTLSGEKLDRQGLDGLKKIKNLMKLQNLLSCAILLFMVFIGIQVFLLRGHSVLVTSQTALFIFCIFAILLSGANAGAKQEPDKKQYLTGILSFVVDVYFIVLFFYMANMLNPDITTLFGRELNQVGPFLDRQLFAAAVVQIAFFLYNFYCFVRRSRRCNWLLCLNVTGIFLTFRYNLWMTYMDNFESLRKSMIRDTLELVIVGGLGIGASLLIAKALQKKM